MVQVPTIGQIRSLSGKVKSGRYMGWNDGYIAVDWGTTNRRAYLIGSDRQIIDSFEDDVGLRAVPLDGFAQQAVMIRARLGDKPMLLAGMVGARTGWRETPYVECPARPEQLAETIVWIEPLRTGIVPGLCQREKPGPDVMRGEEVQILGALAAKLVPPDALICHPGTHSKWIILQDGKIASFQTVMTGEIFSLIKTHSILADLLQEDVHEGLAFRAGVAEALSGRAVLSALFGIRARALLKQADGDGASWASGLLIGADIAAGVKDYRGGPIALIGRPDLCVLYAAAANQAGYETFQIDGAEAFLAGIDLLTEMIA